MTAILLVARAELPDQNFRDSVVLVTNQTRISPIGVIINKPTRIRVAELFPDVENLASLDDKIFFGGPVDSRAISFIFRAAKPPDDATLIFDDVYFSTSPELLHELLARERPMDDLRLFIGYSSWVPGQLENEIANGDWTLAPARSSAIFDAKPERQWQELHPPAEGQRAFSAVDRDG